MSRTPVPATSSVPHRLGRLTATERRIWQAFPHGDPVDLRTGDPDADRPAAAEHWAPERSVRGEVIAALLLGACPQAAGAVAALRVAGARITGPLRLDHGQVSCALQLRGCRFDGPIDLDGAVTGSVDLGGSRLTTLSAYGAQIRGTLDLRDTVVTGGTAPDGGTAASEDAAAGGGADRAVHADAIVVDGSLHANRARITGPFNLINARIGGRLTLIDSELVNRAPGGTALNGGGMQIGRSLFAQRISVVGEFRIPGAQIGSSLLLTGARLDGRGGTALHGDSLRVASDASLRPAQLPGQREPRPFTAIGTVRLPGARFAGELDLGGAHLTPTPGQPALHASRLTVDGILRLDDGLRTDGEIRLTGARIGGHLDLAGMASPDARLTLYAANAAGGVRDDPDSWPGRLNLDGFTYGPFSDYVGAAGRLRVLARQTSREDHDRIGAFRAQPYEQLASYYRSLGNDGEARTVLLARQRALRATFPWWRRIPGRLLDLLVGYGYRPARAFGWAAGLLLASSAYFSRVRPQHVASDDTSEFNPVLYAADHLIPVVRFGQSEAWQYHGVPAVVTVVLTLLGWTLGIAIAAAATRTFNRN
ncbi:pentapeptide repeat-containing protein [Kitasatospora sp. NPDC048540]|uniref:pentapeptide repeat-containing protein n=1 Tax=unclassified Kitasatospora TaxID=2633591 RepID=UPI00053A6496|nr:pentapeptide repeat-containing protein [Kitasatospora sp. MBT63]